MNKRILRAVKAVRVPAGLLFGILTASAGWAQQAGSSGETVQLEEFMVTGSHIPTTETAFDARETPIDITTRKDMLELGFGTVEGLLQHKPYVQASVPANNNQTGFTPSAASVNLRGLGPDATLTLLNGLRVAPYPRGTGGTTAFIDINSFPLASIDQVEVLLDGASATYGADAIAGVVNIKTRRAFNGAEATVRYGNSTASDDAGELIVNGIYGISEPDVNITVGVNYYKRNDMRHSNRDYSAVPPFLSSNSSPYNLQITKAAAVEALGSDEGLPDANQFFAASWDVRQNNNGNVPASDYNYSTSRPANFNFNLTAQSLSQLERYGVFASFDKKLFGTEKWVTYGDVFYQNAEARNELAPSATGNFSNPGGVPIVIPARTANPILLVQDDEGGLLQLAAGTPIPEGYSTFGTAQNVNGNVERISSDPAAFNPFNPFNEDFSGGTRARLAEFGNREYNTTNQAFNIDWGIRGDRVVGAWNVDLVGYFSKVQQVTRDKLVSITNFNRLLNANDPFYDPTSDVYIGTTVPFNPFGYFENPIANNEMIAQYGTVELHNLRESELYGFNAVVSNGELFDLPGGSAGVALGYEFRTEKMLQSPDTAGTSGDVIGSSTDNVTTAARNISAMFFELNLPFLSPENDVAGFSTLGATISGRYEKFWTQDDDAFVPKVSVRWLPIDEQLVLRGSWGQGYRQPSMFELYAQGLNFALAPIDDPVKLINEPEQDVTSASNPQLRAEKSDTWTVGFVYTPDFLSTRTSGFTFGIDYYNIKRTDTVTLDYQNVVDRAFKGEPLLPGESVQRDNSDNIVLVNGVFTNVGAENGEGYDFQASYFWVTDNAGRWDIGFNASYLQKYEIQDTPADPFFDYVGEMTDISFDNQTGDPSPGSGDDAYLPWRAVGFLKWSKGAMNASLQANYLDGFRDFKSEWDPSDPNNPDGFRYVESTLTWDLSFTYALFQDTDAWYGDSVITLTCENILDQDPPRTVAWDNNSTGYPGFIYSPMGRFVSLQVTKKM